MRSKLPREPYGELTARQSESHRLVEINGSAREGTRVLDALLHSDDRA